MSSRLTPVKIPYLSYFQYIPLIFLSITILKPNSSHIYKLLNTNECSSCYLAAAELSYSNLTGSRLSSSNLKDAQLIYTDLSSADLTKANLKNAILVGANLSKADLTGANLQGADLSYANLSQATISLSQIRSTKFVKAIGLDYSLFEENDLTFLVNYYSSINNYHKVYNILSLLLEKNFGDKSDLLLQRSISLLHLGQIELALVDLSTASNILNEVDDPRSAKINLILSNIKSIIAQSNEPKNFSGLGYKALEGINSLSSLGNQFIPSLMPLVRVLYLVI